MPRPQERSLPETSGQTPASSPSPQWYALQVRYRFEKRVAKQLSSKGVEGFLPLRAEVHHWSDRRKTVDVPLFPGYAFVRMGRSAATRLEILQTAGIIGFVAFGSEPLPVPGKQIEDLKRLLSEKVPCSLYPFLKVGQRVKIRGGCLDGLEGILDQHERTKLVISIECIQRSVAVEIQGYELEMI